MIPIRDLNPSGTTPWVVYGIIVVNALVWMFEASLPAQQFSEFIYSWGLTPRQFSLVLLGESEGSFLLPWASVLTHMFLHGGWMHVIGNLWFLYIFGDNVEDALGHYTFALFYILCGLSAAVAQMALGAMDDIPMVGASGAIAGVMGAYLFLYPKAKVVTLVPIFFFITFLRIPAVFFLGIWFFVQFMNGSGSYVAAQSGGVAWWAHVGGFIGGVVLVFAVFRPKKGQWVNTGRKVLH